MNIYKITTLALALTSVLSLIAQTGKIKKGEKYFEGYSYTKAIEKYEELTEKPPSINRQLAISYAKIGNTEKAESYFLQVIESEEKTPADIYNYAAILARNGKHAESESWMKKYESLARSDSRAKQYSANPKFYKTLLKDKGQFTIKNIDINSSQEDFGPSYYKDKVVFASSREGIVSIKRTWNWNGLPFLDMYEATASQENELTAIKELQKGKKNNKYHEGPASFNKEGTYMIFTRNNYKSKSTDGVVNLQLFSAELIDGKWQKEAPLPYNNDEYSVGHASLSADGKTIYFASDMPGGMGGVDIYKASKTIEGIWGKAQNLGNKINTEGDEMFPFIHEENELLFFASNGHIGLGGLDVFVAQIKKDSFGKIKNLGTPINTSKDDFSFILDKNKEKGYFASNRPEGKGDDDIYSFKLLKPFNFGVAIKGITKDQDSIILAEVIVDLYQDETLIDSTISDSLGRFEFVGETNKSYEIKARKETYFGTNREFEILDNEEFFLILILEKDPGLSLYALITNKKTGEPLEGVKMSILDNLTGELKEHITPITGDYRRPLAEKRLLDRGSYNFGLEKEGFFSKTVTYNTEFKVIGQYDVHASLDLGLDPEVKDLAELIEINPINFDYNKYTIRKDAAIELDKIVAIMNKYPGMEVELGSHTDARGSDAYNKKLSARRAKASAAYIKKHITDPARIYGKGYGETQIINKCGNGVECTDEEHEKNRRTEFKVISTGNDKVNVKNNSTDSFGK